MTASPQDPHVTPYQLVTGDGPGARTDTGITHPAAEPDADHQPIPYTLSAQAEALLDGQAGPAAEPGPELPADVQAYWPKRGVYLVAGPEPKPEPEAGL
jgi:hypothetical protein